jgi:hypothetical protein
MSGTTDPLSPTFDITLDGETYTFRKPGIRFSIELGYRCADVRRRAFPAQGGVLPGDFGLDYDAVNFARACAIMELYLVRASEQWPYSPGPDGKPSVDFDKFPADREDTVRRLSNEFDTAVARFRTRRNPDDAPGGTEAVAGQPNPGGA